MSQADEKHTRRKKKRTGARSGEVWSARQRKRRRELGQNFIKYDKTARRIVEEAGVTERDLVVEIGAGSGMLTRSIADKARKVVAVEYDPRWASRLKQGFAANERVEVVEADALSVPLPDEPFRVVANVTFHISTSILHRLLDDPNNSPDLVHLLAQKEFAKKHAGSTPTTLKTLTWSPWWRFEAGPALPSGVFAPEPELDTCMLVAAKRDIPLLTFNDRELFRAFVRGAFEGRGNVMGRVLRSVFTKKQIRRLASDNGFSTGSFPSQLYDHDCARKSYPGKEESTDEHPWHCRGVVDQDGGR